MQTEVLHMTKEIKNKMELEKLEKRRDEIMGFIDTNDKLIAQIIEQGKKLSEDFNKKAKELNEALATTRIQQNVNVGSLSEVNQWIESIKKNDTKPETETEVKEEIKSEESNVVSIDNKKNKSKK
jgi:hypothetical protein